MKFTNIFSKLFFYSIIFVTQIHANQDVSSNDLKAKYLNSNFYLFTDQKNSLYKLFKTQEEFNKTSYPYIKIKQEMKEKLNQESFLITGKNYSIPLDCGLKISLVHFDRNKDTVIVLGGGYMDPKEKLESLVMLFQNYDIVIFDYRTIFKDYKQTKGSTFTKLLENEKEEIIKTVNFVKTLKKYKIVVGWAECYSCFTFAIAQFEQETNKKLLFDKLIFDSTFPSLKILNESTLSDPGLCCNGQFGGSSKYIKTFLQNHFIRFLILKLFQTICFKQSITENLQNKSTTPILFIHGRNDLLVPLQSFLTDCWDKISNKKLLLITPFEHVRNIRDWGIYNYVCNKFITSNNFEFFINEMLSTSSICNESLEEILNQESNYNAKLRVLNRQKHYLPSSLR